ncbi:MAG: translation initiation factor IF-2 [Desulfobacteraceae bacterium]|nr:translation initiation factor IF-2 [Desulfobacteraceae bacterium]
MAKVRVYELARELNLESKKLVEKLQAGGLNIKNYMSTLDEETVLRAREIVSGGVSQVVEEKRIKPTVIRRRKKIVKVEPKVPVAEEEEKPEEEKIEPPEPEATVEEAAKRDTAVERPSEDKVVSEKELPAEEKPPEPAPEVKPEGKKEAVSLKKVPKAKVPPKKAAKPPVKAKVKPKKARKKKVEQPAKIIKGPEEGPLSDILAKKVEKKEVEPRAPVPKPLMPLDRGEEPVVKAKEAKPPKKKKGGKKLEAEEIKSKKPFRRAKKAVYERSDLYDGRVSKRKGKRAAKKPQEGAKKQKRTEITVPKAIKRRIRVPEFVTVAELAKAMGTKGVDLIKDLMGQGIMANITKSLDFETAAVVADDFGYELELDSFQEEQLIAETEDRPEDLMPRPPVVTIMGHVDHGKTSLLDYIRQSNIIGGESGGITQHIGAYYVKADEGDIVFLDTPGHEAFTAMRARGASVTDLIILVVAADDGVMPQTKEAINHARAANIPILVAINKIDKADANPEKVIRELADLDLAPEDWGGETIFGQVSAKTGDGIDELLGLILLQSEMLELKGNPSKTARGSVVEAKLDRSKGPVATVLIRNGTLNQGEFFICGEHYGRVRAMHNHKGKKLLSGGPSVPVEVYGISGVPMAGDEFIVVKDEKTAKQVIDNRREKSRKQAVTKRGLASLEDLFERIKEGEVKELNIVLKTDVQGSLEALNESLVKQSTEEVKLNVLHSATGAISESDVMLASASGAIIIGFNVRANPRVSGIAEKEKVDIRYYNVIYDAIKDIRLAMAGLLEPVFKEEIIGRADIKEIFRIPKVGAIAGCQVTDGHVERNANARLLRDDVVVFDGKIGSLRRFKEDVKEVQSGYECGIGLENFDDIKPGDVFEVYRMKELEAEL